MKVGTTFVVLLVVALGAGAPVARTARGQASSADETGDAAGPRFVAVGYCLRRVVSTDGKTWQHNLETDVPAGANEKNYLLRGVTHGNGLIVAVGSHILTTRDGGRWKEIRPERQWLGDVAYGNRMFVAVGYHRSLHSSDGSQWSEPVRNETVSGRRIAFGDGRFVAVGWMTEEGKQVGYTTTTVDALNWRNVKTAGGQVPRDVAFGNGRFVVVGTNGLRESSVDGVTWEHRSLGEPAEELRNVIWTGEQFIAAGPRAGFASRDGIAWTAWSPRVPSRIAFGKGLFVGCSSGRFTFSTDGRTWTPASAEGKAQIFDIDYVP